MTPDEMNRIGLWLGLVSGLMLIPEVINLIPIDRLERAIERLLSTLENFSNIPQKLHPPSWQQTFSEEGRKKYIEPLTAILGFVSSITWIATIAIGAYTSSNFFVILGFILPAYIAIERILQIYGFRLSITRFIVLFLYSLIFTLIVAPPISLIRILLLMFRAIILRLKNVFVGREVLRAAITLIAILLFIASNILQLLATY